MKYALTVRLDRSSAEHISDADSITSEYYCNYDAQLLVFDIF